MGLIELLLLSLSLSMDAFAASVSKGLGQKQFNVGHALVYGVAFGGFQMLMPLLGWAIGGLFFGFISAWDHWIIFVLLALVGVKMLVDTFGVSDEKLEIATDRLALGTVLALAVATSIDALAVGVSFALLQVDIVATILCIGCVTFALSFLGVFLGSRFGNAYQKPASVIGALVLIGLGCKILIEHLGFFA